MTNTLPPFPSHIKPITWGDAEAETSFVELDSLVDEIRDKNIIEDYTFPEDRAKAQASNLARTAIIGERLFLLGYWKHYTPGRRDRELKRARSLFTDNKTEFEKKVRNFQQDCHLAEDGWAGKKTWAALEELVQFEGSEIPDVWNRIEGDDYPPALQRAIQLRLSIFKLGSRPTNKFKKMSALGLNKLRDILFFLGLLEGKRTQNLHNNWHIIQLFLNHDRIIDALCDLTKRDRKGNLSFAFHSKADRGRWQSQKARKRLGEFIAQLAKIELWLLGAPIEINTIHRYPVKGISPSPRKNRDLKKHIIQFYQELGGLKANDAEEKAKKLTPYFFRMIRQQEGVTLGNPVISEESDSEILETSMSDAEVKKSIRNKRSFGTRIVDGFKRLFRWFKKVAKKIITFFANKIRIFYRYAMKAFKVIRHIISSVYTSFKTLISGSLCSPEGHAFAKIERDLDFRLYLSSSENNLDDNWLGKRINLFADRFSLSVQIMKLVFVSLSKIASNNWVGVVRAFVKHMRKIVDIYYRIIEIEDSLEPQGIDNNAA